jgi:RNA polymerase sigma-70 factor (ECF subfamily)
VAAKTASAQRTLRIVPGGRPERAVSEPTDEQIVDAIERGDDRLSGAIYDRLAGIVDGTIFRVLGRREADHDDLVQSAFEQIVLTISRRSYARACSLRAWASTVASHVALNALRSRCRERRVVDRFCDAFDQEQIVSAPCDVEREVGSRREFDRLRAQLAAMDQAKALTVLLHDAHGYDLAEVAVLTECSVAAAQSRLVRGRKELAERMRSSEGAELSGGKKGMGS